MSLAREISEKLDKRKQGKGEPEPLPLGIPEQPSKDRDADHGQLWQPKPETPGSLFNKPIAIESRYLDGSMVYLVPNEIMASEIEKQGLIVFTPQEISIMKKLERSMSKEQWISHLKAIFQTKKAFGGPRVIE